MEWYHEFLLMLLMSVFAGGIIGVERQWRKKLAGVRTMVLVSLGSTIFVSLSAMVETDTSPTRIASQVVSGIGFLAGSIILRNGFNVTGLNTAATLWCTAAVGVLIGAGFITEGFLAAIIITLVNIVIRFFSQRFDKIAAIYSSEKKVEGSNSYLIIHIKETSEVAVRTEVINQLDRYYLYFCSFVCQDLVDNTIQLQIEIEWASNYDMAIKEIIMNLSQNKNILEIYQLSEDEWS